MRGSGCIPCASAEGRARRELPHEGATMRREAMWDHAYQTCFAVLRPQSVRVRFPCVSSSPSNRSSEGRARSTRLRPWLGFDKRTFTG